MQPVRTSSLRATGFTGRSLVTARPVVHKAARGALIVRNGSTSSNDLKNGLTLEIDGAPWKVVEFLHVKPGKGAAFVRSKLKNCITGNTVEKTFRAGESLNTAEVSKRSSTFTYEDGDDYVFMDVETFEEARVPVENSWAQWVTEGMEVNLVFYEGRVISVDVPGTCDYEVVQTDPGVKGNTAQGGSKPATLSSGATIQVPLFIEEGEMIKVNTGEGKYLSRSSS